MPPAQSGAARRRGGPQASSCFPTATRGTSATPWPHSPPRWIPPPLATPPSRAPRPPPRRRRGELGREPQLRISRAPQHQDTPRNVFVSLSRQLPAPNPQNTAVVDTHAGELELTIDPPLQTRSAHADAANSFASLSHSSPTTSCRLSTTGAPSPPIPYSEPPLLAIDEPPPAVPAPTKATHGFLSTLWCFPTTFPQPPVSPLAGFWPAKLPLFFNLRPGASLQILSEFQGPRRKSVVPFCFQK
jgi:hypothetical protein